MDTKCKRTCNGQCEVLENLLRQETEALHRYENLIKMCDYPEVQSFLQNLLDAKRAFQARIITKIDELQVQSETAHRVMDSFESFS